MTSTPPLPAAAMTACLAPKSTPTTLMFVCILCKAKYYKSQKSVVDRKNERLDGGEDLC